MTFTTRSLKRRSHSNKIYLPQNKRENQYLLAELKINDELLIAAAQANEQAPDWAHFCQQAANMIFDQCAAHQIHHACVIANDKLPRVRFSHELQVWETSQQLLYLYDPTRHFGYRRFLSGDKQTKKLRILFLASGDDLYHQAAAFSQQVIQATKAICEQFKLDPAQVKFRDHQHLTWDIFARDKDSETSTKACKIRPLEYVYQKQQVALPSSPLAYAIATLPIAQNSFAMAPSHSYGELFQNLYDHFCTACQQNDLSHAAMVANGHFPIVRRREDALQTDRGELVKIDFNPCEQESNQSTSIRLISDEGYLTNELHLVFFASDREANDHGYGSYLQRIEKALIQLSKQLELDTKGNELMIRFHQHLDASLDQY